MLGLAFGAKEVASGDLGAAILSLWDDGAAWVLGHAFDGVLWGYAQDGDLVMAADRLAGCALLRRETLLDLKVFSAAAELRVYREETGLRACRVHETDAAGDTEAAYDLYRDQPYELLRGYDAKVTPGEFVVLTGSAGQQHTPPAVGGMPERLLVRHYYRSDDDGWLRLFEHRLLGLDGRARP